jgi:hypothetical protein
MVINYRVDKLQRRSRENVLPLPGTEPRPYITSVLYVCHYGPEE